MNNLMKRDIWLYSIFVATLDLSAVGVIALAMSSQSTLAEVIVALGSAAIGGLAGLLALSPLNR